MFDNLGMSLSDQISFSRITSAQKLPQNMEMIRKWENQLKSRFSANIDTSTRLWWDISACFYIVFREYSAQ